MSDQIQIKDPVVEENRWVSENFDLDQILEFQLGHSLQVVVGRNGCYYGYIDGVPLSEAFTPIMAMIAAVKNYTTSNFN